MNYEEKYKEALEKARIYRNHLIETGDNTNEIEYIFPELINEDERIREEILSVVKQFNKNTTLCGKNYDYNKWIAWLEKQGEEKVYSVWVGGYEINDYYLTEKEAKKLTREYKENGYDDIIIEKQGEQKPNNNTEPKFNVGDWITNGDYTWKIVEVKPLDYILQSQDGNVVNDTISYVDGNFSLWTIQNAKDGDVLYCKNNGIEYIVMNKGINEIGNIDSYFRYKSLGGFGIDIPSVLSVKYDNITPATKEQRDFLFQKMHEVGYEWYAETKQLIKIKEL